jgi:3-methyladenine DNA glycosylase AlkD
MSKPSETVHHARRLLLEELRRRARPADFSSAVRAARYAGSSKPRLGLSAADYRQMAVAFQPMAEKWSGTDLSALIALLVAGETSDEVTLAGVLLAATPRLRGQLEPALLDGWLDHVEGWAETDAFCQSVYSAEEMLSSWAAWAPLLRRFARDLNSHKRRASLVLLTRPVRESPDARLADLAFENIDALRSERHILVIKAVSWLLRDLTRNHPQRVRVYVDEWEGGLPRVAVREVRSKLETGLKQRKR